MAYLIVTLPMTFNDQQGHLLQAFQTQFVPHDAMLARYMLSSCVHPSQVWVLLRWLNLRLCKQCCTIAQKL